MCKFNRVVTRLSTQFDILAKRMRTLTALRTATNVQLQSLYIRCEQI